MTHYEIVPATLEHAEALAKVMRVEDAAECWAASHCSPLEALKACLAVTRHPIAVLYKGEVLAMFGIGTGTVISASVEPWMLGSRDIPKHAKALLRVSRLWVEDVRRQFHLANRVDARYSAAIRWLRWLGFTIYPAEPFGPDGALFHRFEMRG